MIFITHLINLKGSHRCPRRHCPHNLLGVGQLVSPYSWIYKPYNMTGLVTLVTGFLFERTTFIIIISQTGIGTLISRLFRGWGTLF